MKIKDKFYRIRKEYGIYINENGDRGSLVESYETEKDASKYGRAFILNRLFCPEDEVEEGVKPVEWEKMEKKLGFTREELLQMPFENLLMAVRDYYIYSIDYIAEDYAPGEGYGGATPYSF